MSPVSSILTKEVIDAFGQIGGDFSHCVPFALLEARRYFRLAAYSNPSDSDENEARKLACEVLARKIVARTPMSEQYSLLSARYTVVESDGDESSPISGEPEKFKVWAVFILIPLRSLGVGGGPARDVLPLVRRGAALRLRTVARPSRPAREGGRLDRVHSSKLRYTSAISHQLTLTRAQYERAKHQGGFLKHFDPSRVGVPRYQVGHCHKSKYPKLTLMQFFFRIILWVIFIGACWSAQMQQRSRH